jgi:pectinesterase
MKLVALLSTCVLFAATPLLADDQSPKVRIVLVGDSTVTNEGGWGGAFARRLAPGVECLNHAKGGSSSRSFYGGRWTKALADKPDYVLIQFGHNDQPGKGPQRETDAATTYRDFLRKYIDEARAVGAKPILVTSVVRRQFDPDGSLPSR